MKPDKTAAVIYARFSSHNQRDESIEQQIAECRSFAAASGIEVTDVYADTATTGKTDRRPNFQRLRRDAEKRKFGIILAYKSSRIARNMLNALVFEADMEKHGIQVLYAKEEFGNNAAGRFALRTMMNVNQFYSENMAEDIRRNQADNATKALANGPAPFGYTSDSDGHFVIVEDQAAIVREIFSRTIAGEAFSDIAASFNARGYRTRKGNAWGKGSFYSILHNERYTGTYIFDGIRVPDGMPQIITEEVFHVAQHRLASKKNPQGRHRTSDDYLLTGKLYCGECGAHMIGMSGTGKTGSTHHYYVCNDKRTGGTCHKSNARKDAVEASIAAALRRYILQDEVISWIADVVDERQRTRQDSQEIISISSRLAEVDTATKNIIKAIEQGTVSEALSSRLRELEKERSALSGRLAIIRGHDRIISRDQVVSWLRSFSVGDVHDKQVERQLFNAFLIRAYLFDDGHTRLILDLFEDRLGCIEFAPDGTPLGEAEFPPGFAEGKNRVTTIYLSEPLREPRAVLRLIGSHFVLDYWG